MNKAQKMTVKEKADARERKRRLQHSSDIKELMKDPRFRRVLRQWITDSKAFSETFTTDPYQSAFNQGMRKIGRSFYNEIGIIDPDGQRQMQLEGNQAAHLEQQNRMIDEERARKDDPY